MKEILQYMKKKITQHTKNNKNIIGEKHLPEIFKEQKKQKKNIRNSFENNKQNKSQIIIITKASTQQVHTSPKSSDKWTID